VAAKERVRRDTQCAIRAAMVNGLTEGEDSRDFERLPVGLQQTLIAIEQLMTYEGWIKAQGCSLFVRHPMFRSCTSEQRRLWSWLW